MEVFSHRETVPWCRRISWAPLPTLAADRVDRVEPSDLVYAHYTTNLGFPYFIASAERKTCIKRCCFFIVCPEAFSARHPNTAPFDM